MARKGLNQSQVAHSLNIVPSSVNQWLKGKTQVDRKHLPQLAKILGVTVDDLLAGRIPEENGVILEHIKAVKVNENDLYTFIPYLSIKAQADIPTIIYENCRLSWIEESYAVLLPENLKNKQSMVIDITGDSMEPVMRNDAKVLAVHVPTNEIRYESGAVYAVLYANRFVVKRIKTNTLATTEILTLHSDNEKFGEIAVASQDIKCMWKVIAKVWEPVQ